MALNIDDELNLPLSEFVKLPTTVDFQVLNTERFKIFARSRPYIRLGTEFENADMLMSNIGIFGLPVAYTASHMAKRLSAENLAFTAVIKLVLVVLALTGCATLWFIVLLDFAASVFGVLNIVRMPSADTLSEDPED